MQARLWHWELGSLGKLERRVSPFWGPHRGSEPRARHQLPVSRRRSDRHAPKIVSFQPSPQTHPEGLVEHVDGPLIVLVLGPLDDTRVPFDAPCQYHPHHRHTRPFLHQTHQSPSNASTTPSPPNRKPNISLTTPPPPEKRKKKETHLPIFSLNLSPLTLTFHDP